MTDQAHRASQLNVWLDDYAAGLELAGRSSANAGLAEASRLRAIEVRAFMARRSDETGPSNDQLVAIIDTFGQTCFDCGLIRDAWGADPEPARIAQQAARLAVHVALDLKDSRRGYGPPLQTTEHHEHCDTLDPIIRTKPCNCMGFAAVRVHDDHCPARKAGDGHGG